ncbi:MAG: SPFH domain-containing protein, partial [Bacteroidota bacterium]
MKTSKIIYLLLLPLLISSCAIIRPGEVGLKQKLGKLSEDVYKQGTVLYNPIITKVIRTNVQINNIELSL